MSRILIVEPNARIGALVSGQLRQEGYEAEDVRNGVEAAMALRAQIANLILLDSEVPVGGAEDGPHFPAARQIQHDPDDSVPSAGQGESARHHPERAGDGTRHRPHQKLEEALEAGPVDPSTYKQIKEEIRKLSNLPTMPAAHSKLLVLLGKADAEIDLNLVSGTLAQDPALSAKVMRTSRSAYHGFQGNILSQSVVFLGASAMKDRAQAPGRDGAHQRHRRPHHGYRL